MRSYLDFLALSLAPQSEENADEWTVISNIIRLNDAFISNWTGQPVIKIMDL